MMKLHDIHRKKTDYTVVLTLTKHPNSQVSQGKKKENHLWYTYGISTIPNPSQAPPCLPVVVAVLG
jgi:hypothetical protein